MIPIHCAFTDLAHPASLVPFPRNPNTHPDRQIAALAEIIRAQGWRNPIVVSNRSGYIVAGHGRLAAALLLNETQVPVDRQDFENDAAEWAHIIADNRIPELAQSDEGALKQLLCDLKLEEGANLNLTGFDESEIERMLAGVDHLGDEPENKDAKDSAAWLKLSKGTGGKAVKLDLTNEERDGFAALVRAFAEFNGSSSGFINHLLGVMGKKENQFPLDEGQ